MNELPEELVISVCEFLEPRSLVNIMTASRSLLYTSARCLLTRKTNQTFLEPLQYSLLLQLLHGTNFEALYVPAVDDQTLQLVATVIKTSNTFATLHLNCKNLQSVDALQPVAPMFRALCVENGVSFAKELLTYADLSKLESISIRASITESIRSVDFLKPMFANLKSLSLIKVEMSFRIHVLLSLIPNVEDLDLELMNIGERIDYNDEMKKALCGSKLRSVRFQAYKRLILNDLKPQRMTNMLPNLTSLSLVGEINLSALEQFDPDFIIVLNKLKHLSLSNCPVNAKMMLAECYQLTTFSSVYSKGVSFSFLDLDNTCLQHLTKVEIMNTQVAGQDLILLVSHCPLILSLRVSCSVGRSDRCKIELQSTTRSPIDLGVMLRQEKKIQLRKLDLSYTQISLKVIQFIIAAAQNLEVLNLNGIEPISPYFYRPTADTDLRLPQLQVISAKRAHFGCVLDVLEWLQSLQVTSLTLLNISRMISQDECTDVQQKFSTVVKHLVQQSPSLSTLCALSWADYNDTHLPNKSIPVTKLYLSACKVSIPAILQLNLTSLTKLCLEGGIIKDHGSACAIVQKCQSVVILTLDLSCIEISDQLLNSIGENCRAVQTLVINGDNSRVKEEAFLKLVLEQLPCLQAMKIDFNPCDKNTIVELHSKIRRLRTAPRILLPGPKYIEKERNRHKCQLQ